MVHMTQTCGSDPKEEGEKPLIFLPLLGVSSFPLLTSTELEGAGNKHCPFLSEDNVLTGSCVSD